MKERIIFPILRTFLFPIAKLYPLNKWNYLMGRAFDIKLYGKVKPNPVLSTSGSANINILIDLFNDVKNIEGSVAECGVFRGATIAYLSFYLNSQKIEKKIYGFDSFEGFDEKELEMEKTGGYYLHIDKEDSLFKNNSIKLVEDKLKLAKVSKNICLVKGYFEDTLNQYSEERYCFVHLDCDLYSSYKTCLNYFYSRMNSGGVVIFDEYLDPVYTKCTDVIDEFLTDKPEKLEQIIRDNQIRYFFKKQ
ncbi:MAG TPA: TylF/MycF/NovP-related O-methyltransferase [Ferruginibacter sp.]|jgi:hypothetical protein|nr:TylF/MycF/NovP-related O-methyltransferase [Ferruginibacter sp.]